MVVSIKYEMIPMNINLPEIPDWDLLCRYLGYLDNGTKAQSEKIMGRLKEVCLPKITYREIAVERKGDGIYLYNEKFGGEDIKKHLAESERCILLGLTLGMGADRLIRTLESSDMSSAVVCDTLCSVLTEQLCADARQEIAKEYEGLYLTDSYSPGYGDLHLDTNRSMEKLLDMPKRIGVSVTESMLLLPRKSITAIIGISKTETKGHLAGCENCRIYDKCTLRREGKSCGKDI